MYIVCLYNVDISYITGQPIVYDHSKVLCMTEDE